MRPVGTLRRWRDRALLRGCASLSARLLAPALACSMLACTAVRPTQSGSLGVIHNDTIWHDTDGNEIWSNGGDILREGDTFYWLGYETRPDHPWRMNLYASSDLANWRFLNDVAAMKGEFRKLGWAGRPALLHNPRTGKYVIVFEADGPEWTRHKVGFAVSDTIDGNYTLVRTEYPEPGRSTGDQSVYREGADAYLVTVLDAPGFGGPNNYDLAIYKLTPDFLAIDRKVFEGFAGPRGRSGDAEAPSVIKRGATYYLFVSGLRGWHSTATQYATAPALEGPWSAWRILYTLPESCDSFNTQHDLVMPIVGREGTVWLYVGDRYTQWHTIGIGRNVFLPLVWQDNIPTLKWLRDWRVDVSAGRFSPVHKAREQR